MKDIFELNPTIHYIRYSICGISHKAFYSLSYDLIKLFGRYKKKKVKKSNGKVIWINDYSKYGVTLTHPRDDNMDTAMLTFPANVDIYSLVDILKKYHFQSPYSKNYNQNIYSMEVKFDFRMNDRNYYEHIDLANILNRYLFPKYPNISFSETKLNKLQNKGEYLLGELIHYFYPCGNDDKNNIGKPNFSKKGTFGKIYMRGKIKNSKKNRHNMEEKNDNKAKDNVTLDQPDCDDGYHLLNNYLWLIRLEVSFKKRQLITLLNKYDGFDFNGPYDLPRIMNQIYHTKFSDYYDICTINLKEFIDKLGGLLRKKNKLTSDLNEYINILKNKENTKVNVYHFMKKISRIFNQAYLYGILKNYKNKREYPEFQKVVKKRLGIDLSTELTYLG